MDHVRAQKSTDQRLIDITARVAREMGVPQRHLVCEWTGMWYPIPGVWHNVGSYKIGDDIDWALMWPAGTIDSYTDNGLLGILGHEVGHLLGEHEKSGIDLRGIRISKALFL